MKFLQKTNALGIKIFYEITCAMEKEFVKVFIAVVLQDDLEKN
jgi:hypothetical protein